MKNLNEIFYKTYLDFAKSIDRWVIKLFATINVETRHLNKLEISIRIDFDWYDKVGDSK